MFDVVQKEREKMKKIINIWGSLALFEAGFVGELVRKFEEQNSRSVPRASASIVVKDETAAAVSSSAAIHVKSEFAAPVLASIDPAKPLLPITLNAFPMPTIPSGQSILLSPG